MPETPIKAPGNRFDYVRYDEVAEAKGRATKGYFQTLETWLNVALPDGRAKSLVMTKLEEAYMWCGKALRDEQVSQRGAELQEGRGNE